MVLTEEEFSMLVSPAMGENGRSLKAIFSIWESTLFGDGRQLLPRVHCASHS